MAETTELLQIGISLKTFVGASSTGSASSLGEPELDINKLIQLDVTEQQWMKEKVAAAAVAFALTLPSSIPNTPQVFYLEVSSPAKININSTGFVRVDDAILIMSTVTTVTVTNDLVPDGEIAPVVISVKYARFGTSA